MRDLPATRSLSLTSFRVGAWCWVVTGSGHLLGDAYLRSSPSAEDEAVDAVLRAQPFELLSLHRSLYEVTMGFSLGMGACMVFVGILLLYVARLTAHRSALPAALLGLAMSSVAFAISAWLEPPPPIALFSLACIAFGLAVRSAVRASTEGGTR